MTVTDLCIIFLFALALVALDGRAGELAWS